MPPLRPQRRPRLPRLLQTHQRRPQPDLPRQTRRHRQRLRPPQRRQLPLRHRRPHSRLHRHHPHHQRPPLHRRPRPRLHLLRRHRPRHHRRLLRHRHLLHRPRLLHRLLHHLLHLRPSRSISLSGGRGARRENSGGVRQGPARGGRTGARGQSGRRRKHDGEPWAARASAPSPRPRFGHSVGRSPRMRQGACLRPARFALEANESLFAGKVSRRPRRRVARRVTSTR